MKKLLMVLSGGQDSTIATFLAKEQFDEIYALTFDYGQTHTAELVAANRIAIRAGVTEHEVVSVPKILKSTSPLVSDNELHQYSSYETMVSEVGEKVENTFVPMRNMLFATIAANRAIYHGCSAVGLGVCESDSANYPDCTEKFIDALELAINTALTRSENKLIELYTPLLHMPKSEAIKLAYQDEVCWQALAYSHTSYAGEFPPLDKNHANVLRAKSFERAGLPDPLILRAVDMGLMNLPDTPNYQGAAK